MPERPDLDYAIPILGKALQGLEIVSTELHKPAVLRQAFEGTLDEVLVGSRIASLSRHLHFIRFELESANNVELIIAPMLAGCLSVHPTGKSKKRDRAMTFQLTENQELRYFDRVQMGKVYVIPRGRLDLVPGFEKAGVDVLDNDAFSFARFCEIAKKRRDQVKVFLLDKSALDSFGNAYADEVLFAAGIHPKTFVRKLEHTELKRLHTKISQVLQDAAIEIHKRAPATDEKLRDFLKVRGKHKQPCPVCQTPIRKAGVRGFDAYFCPTCQPETRKSGIVSWTKP